MIRYLLCCLALAATAYGFEIEHAREVVSTLSSDAFTGRRSGHPGGQKTEQYLADRLASYGLKPGIKGGFFQEVPLLVTMEESASLTLMNHELGKIPLVQGIDYTIVTHSGSRSFMGEVVIAGMGYLRPDKDRDDYGELDCDHKIVVIIRDTPESPYSFAEDFSRGRTLAWAKEKGASAVMWHDKPFPLNGAAIVEDDYDPEMSLLYIGDRVLRLLLDGSGYSEKSYKTELKKHPIPLSNGYEMWLSVGARKLSTSTARNVMGIVYGTDPVLKNEVIVVGAHLDHIGKNSNGVIYNGADDNASGSGVVSELARAIASGGPLKRSVMFVHFMGEEDNLLGADYFVNNSTIPFGNIACMLNFDMVGLGNGIVGMAGGHLLGEPWYEYVRTMSDAELERLKFYREDGHGQSDHAPFMKTGAPTLAFWASGSHPFYHSYTDDASTMIDSVLENVGNRAEHFLRFIADYQEPLASRSDSLRLMARMTTTLNLRGFFVDPSGTLPSPTAVTAAWLPHDALMPMGDLASRSAEVHYVCKERNLSSDGLKEAVDAWREDREGVFLSIPEAAFVGRSTQAAISLVRQGLSLVSLSPGNGKAGGKMSNEIESLLLESGLYAEVPLDFGTPARVTTWGNHAIVSARLTDFAAVPEEIRAALLTSKALLVLEVEPDLTAEQIETVRPGRQRRLHFNFGNAYPELRETEMKSAFRKLYEAGFNRDDILLLTGGNLRRFFE